MIQKLFPAFGTINSITISGERDPSILDPIKERMMEIHNRFSFFSPESEISRINQQAGIQPVPVSRETLYLLSLAQKYAKETKGTFDVTAGAMSELWRDAIRSAQLPSQADITYTRAHCNIEKLELDKDHSTAFLREQGMKLDLGGLVKGYAADAARSMLKAQNIQEAQINFGGTVAVMGKGQKIGIQNPFQKTGTSMASILLKNKAIVTSGSYERCFFHQGRRFHHIIDPRTGNPSSSGLISVSLIGDQAVELDALATGICCLGREEGLSIAGRYGLSAIFVTDNGSVQVTENLQGQISFDV